MRSISRLAAAALMATALGTAAAMAQDAPRIVVVVHGQASDPFWSVVKNGVDEAAEGHRAPRSSTARPPPSTWSRWRS